MANTIKYSKGTSRNLKITGTLFDNEGKTMVATDEGDYELLSLMKDFMESDVSISVSFKTSEELPIPSEEDEDSDGFAD